MQCMVLQPNIALKVWRKTEEYKYRDHILLKDSGVEDPDVKVQIVLK